MKHTRYATAAFSLLTAVLFLTFGHITTAAPGDLDPSFSDDGKLIDFLSGGGENVGSAVAVQADGKIVVAGTSDGTGTTDDFAVVRFNIDGSPDTSFDGDGQVITSINSSDDRANAITIQSDGKILVAGYTWNGSNYDFAVVRYNTDGSLDPSFDGDGKTVTGVGTSNDLAEAIAIQPDGKIVVAGHSSVGGLNTDFAVVRYNTNGSIDLSFDLDGKVITPVGPGSDEAHGVAIQPDGRILVTGFSRNVPLDLEDFSLVRYNVNGSLDTSFDGDGKVITPVSDGRDYSYASAIQSDGRIVLAGRTSNQITGNTDFALVRYNTDGSLDTSFDGDGKVFTPFGTAADVATAVSIQPDGRIVAAGYSHSGSSTNLDFAVARYNPDGSLDISFDGDGKAITPLFGTSQDFAQAVALQPDGKVVLAGYSNNGANNDFAIVRYHSDGSLDLSFDSDGKVIADIGFLAHTAKSLAVQSDGKIVVAGSRFNGLNNDFAIFRYNPDGSPDNSFGGNGKVITAFGGTTNDQAFAIVIQPDGKIVAAGESTADFAVARYNQDGSLDPSFDGDGKVTTAFSPDGGDHPSSIALQSDGKIVVAGTERGLPTAYRIALVRYNANGSLDTSFDGDGKVMGPFSTSANSVAIQSDGKIVTGGAKLNPFPTYEVFCLFRYNADGSLDTSFDGDGQVTTRIGIGTSAATTLAVQPNGKIVAAGSATFSSDWREDFALARYNTDGSLDRSFDWDGIVITPIRQTLDYAFGVAVQTDGKIITAGWSLRPNSVDYDFAVVRYKANGSLDDTPASFSALSSWDASESLYGGGGKVFVDLGGKDMAFGLALDSLGRAVVAGESNQRFAIVRLLGDSKPTTPIFSISGRILTPAGRGIPNARVTMTDTENVSRTLITNAFGYYRFVDIPGGSTLTISVSAKRYSFTGSPQTVTLTEDLALDFHASQ